MRFTPNAIKLLNGREKRTFEQLRTVCERHASYVCPKVRLSDALPITRDELAREDYNFSWKAHLDFVVMKLSDSTPLFAVEFDGPWHQTPEQKERDVRKNRICSFYDLPLLRIRDKHLTKRYRNFDMLTYLVSWWFISQDIDRAAEKDPGIRDEAFDPTDMLYDPAMPRSHGYYPYQLDRDASSKLHELVDAGVLREVSFWQGENSEGMLAMIAHAAFPDDRIVWRRSLMWQKGFPVDGYEILRQIVTIHLLEHVRWCLAGNFKPVPPSVFAKRFAHLSAGFVF